MCRFSKCCDSVVLLKHLICLFEHHDQPDTAKSTRPMAYILGGSICLFNQWRIMESVWETCLEIYIFESFPR